MAHTIFTHRSPQIIPLLLWFIILLAPPLCFAQEQESWPEGFLKFAVPLTSPLSEWRPNDLGRKTSAKDRKLLERFKPRIYIHPESYPPVDFYDYYLPRTVVRGEGRKIVQNAPDRATLKKIERVPGLYLDFDGEQAPCKGADCRDYMGTLYGRAYHEVMQTPPGVSPSKSLNVTVLKYSAAFAASGLPGGISTLKEWAAKLAGDPWVWHELDIHGAIHIIVAELGGKSVPIAVVLAQHNHFRTYIVGKDIFMSEDKPAEVCYAQRSNEPYPCPNGEAPARMRAIGDPSQASYIVLGGSPPLAGGEDIVTGPKSGGVGIVYDLKFLTDQDPLYTSWIPLGDKLKILGFWGGFWRQGPPGMDLNTWPELTKYSDIAQLWYLRDGDEKVVKLFNEHLQGFDNAHLAPILEYGSRLFWRELEKVNENLSPD